MATPEFQNMIDAVAKAKQDLVFAESRLAGARATCNGYRHDWGKDVYTPIRTKGYRTQSLMGYFTKNEDGSINAPWVDVPATEIPQWTQECVTCGLTRTTQQTTEIVTKSPRF